MEKARPKKYTDDSMYTKFKNKQNKFLVLEVRMAVILGGADTTRNGHKTGFCDIGNILFLVLCQYVQFAKINQAVYL